MILHNNNIIILVKLLEVNKNMNNLPKFNINNRDLKSYGNCC